MTPQDMDTLLFSPFQQALGKTTVERINRQLDNYAYYSGKQHRNQYGELVNASEVERPPGLDYDPTRYATNYFKAIVDRKARWQMGGKHGISVPRRQLDAIEATLMEGYTPSAAQQAENKRAEDFERLLYRLWDENKMRTKLVQAARDRLIADRVVCKIAFNRATGKMRWIFRPDSEYVPVYSEDDFEDLIGAHLIKSKRAQFKGEEVDALEIESYRLVDGQAYLKVALYRESDLSLIKTLQEEAALGLDFIPLQEFAVNELISQTLGESEISALREQNDVLNQLNEDAIDSMKFEMFPMTAILNATPGAGANIQVAPGALAEISGGNDAKAADIKKVESGFRWKDAFKDQYMRVKAAMHEISGLPQIVPQELNFGGLNGEALQVMFHDIITDTEEHWLSWGYALAELHAKTVRYMQARLDAPSFAYDKGIVRAIGTHYDNEIRFVLPLPDNRKELVELLEMETAAGFESNKGAMERLGVENIQAKTQEIESERTRRRNTSVAAYGEGVDDEDA
ncbi:phage portal protein [Sporosarcina sp. ITBMC105]